jgi:hypothetical protein
MRVDGDISDLFFNTQHTTDSDGSFEQLEEEAADVLNSLRRLGIDDGSEPIDLVNDFLDRL